MKTPRLAVCVLLALYAIWQSGATSSAAGSASLAALDVPYTESFDALANTGTSGAVPAGWAFLETGTNANATYSAGTGSANTGDTYSFGSAGSSERAFGQLRSGSLVSTLGAAFVNDTGSVITSVDISYIGEQWRLGTADRAPDRIDFQYSLDATSLSSGTWTDVDALDFASPSTAGAVGLRDGNAPANRQSLSASLTNGISLPPGASLWIRWLDADAAGADDGLSVDDFSLTPHSGLVPTGPRGTGSASPDSLTPGSTTTLHVMVTPGTAPPSTAVLVTADLSSIGGSAAAILFDDGSNGDATANDLTFTATVAIPVGTAAGPKALPIVITDGEGRSASTSIALTVTQPSVPIHDIQGDGDVSPLSGAVTTEGIVTGVKFNGFFIQSPEAEYDGNPNSSEGIFVFTSSAPPAAAVVGNRVRVTGTVSEFGTAGDPQGLTATELVSPTFTALATGQPLPTAVTLTAADLFPGASFLQLEKYEGMRVHLDTVVSTTGTDGTVTEASARSTTSGLFFAVLPTAARPFREPGIQAPLPVPAEAPAGATIPVFDGNYERIGVDTYSVFLTPAIAAVFPPPVGSTLEITTGVTVTNVTGPLDYSFRSYIVDAEDWGRPVAVTPNAVPVAVSGNGTGEFSIATFNMERFFDTVNDPSVSDVVLTPAAFDGRLNKASLVIRNVLKMPDILGVEEVENLATLQAVAARVNSDAVAAAQGDPAYQAFLVEGNDVGGIDSGFLVRGDRVTVTSVTQYGKSTTFTPAGGTPALLNDRPPLVLDATISNPAFQPYPVTVIVNHLRSLSGIDEADGARIRAKRAAQADYLALLIRSFQDQGKHVVSVGDYNAFDINDGYVDVIGIVRGAPVPASEVTVSSSLAAAQLPSPTLIDAIALAPADQRYSFLFDGIAQELDHVLFTPGLPIARIEYARVNADFPESYRGDFNRPERLSDHDPIVVYFTAPGLDTTAPEVTVPAAFTIEGDTAGGAAVVYQASAQDAVDGEVPVFCAPASGTVFPVGATTVTCTAADSHGNVGSARFVITVTDTTPPSVIVPARQRIEATSAAGAAATFTVGGSDIVSGTVAAICFPASGSTFPLGTTVVSCSATDASGNVGSASFQVRVVDTTAPAVTSTVASPSSIWPPNNKMVRVTVVVHATDAVSPVTSKIVAITGNDGATPADWAIKGPLVAEVRAERRDRGDGRTYTLKVKTTDAAGNATISTATVRVPHDGREGHGQR